MFIGHYALALAGKRAAPHASLGTLFLSVQFLDLLWPIFLFLGWEHLRVQPGNTAFTPLDFYDYPISHSLAAALGWSILLGGLCFARNRAGGSALIVGPGVLSHWVLDFIVHRPDLPLLPGGSYKAGLGLWNSVAGTLAVETALYVAGVWIYLRATTPRDRVGSYGLGVFLALLVVIYIATAFGPPPPNESVVAFSALGQWLFVPWLYWIDRHRESVVR